MSVESVCVIRSVKNQSWSSRDPTVSTTHSTAPSPGTTADSSNLVLVRENTKSVYYIVTSSPRCVVPSHAVIYHHDHFVVQPSYNKI